MPNIKKILFTELVYVYKGKNQKISFNIGLYILLLIGFGLAWYLTEYVIYNIETLA